MLLRDARDYQILFLSLFLVLGIGTRDWTIRIDLILVLIVTCCVTQWLATSLWNYFQQNPLITLPLISNLFGLQIAPGAEEERGTIDNAETKGFEMIRFIKPENWQQKLISTLKLSNIKLSFRSAVITSLGLSLLLRSDHYSTMILAGSLAILSKFIFQFRHKHFFNPANFGIISALILTQDAWVSPGQWGDDWWYALVFLGTGGMVLKRVGRWDTTAAFLGTYAGMEAIRNIWLGWTWDVFLHRLMSGSLLLFALFMITDPRSIPNAKVARLLWAICIAVFTFILRNQFFISTAVFWALFALSPLTIIFDNIWSAPRFSWAMVSGQLSVVGGKEPLAEDGVQG